MVGPRDGTDFSAKQALWPPAYELRPQALSCAPGLCVVVDSAVSAVVRR